VAQPARSRLANSHVNTGTIALSRSDPALAHAMPSPPHHQTLACIGRHRGNTLPAYGNVGLKSRLAVRQHHAGFDTIPHQSARKKYRLARV
jgi:hypothetical protein